VAFSGGSGVGGGTNGGGGSGGSAGAGSAPFAADGGEAGPDNGTPGGTAATTATLCNGSVGGAGGGCNLGLGISGNGGRGEARISFRRAPPAAGPYCIGRTEGRDAAAVAATSHPFTAPVVPAGTLLVLVVGGVEAGAATMTFTAPAGWSPLASQHWNGGGAGAGDCPTSALFTRESTGSDDGTVTSDVVCEASYMCLAYERADEATIDVASATSAGLTLCDPPSVGPVAAGTKRWVAFCVQQGTQSSSGALTPNTAGPAGWDNWIYIPQAFRGGGPNGVTIGVAELSSTNLTENPGTFAGASAFWNAHTLAIHEP
jgi:hypothetical protein